jgi:hypothetical protein
LKAIAWHLHTDCGNGRSKNAGIEDAIAGADPNRCIERPFGSSGRESLRGPDRRLMLLPLARKGIDIAGC